MFSRLPGERICFSWMQCLRLFHLLRILTLPEGAIEQVWLSKHLCLSHGTGPWSIYSRLCPWGQGQIQGLLIGRPVHLPKPEVANLFLLATLGAPKPLAASRKHSPNQAMEKKHYKIKNIIRALAVPRVCVVRRGSPTTCTPDMTAWRVVLGSDSRLF